MSSIEQLAALQAELEALNGGASTPAEQNLGSASQLAALQAEMEALNGGASPQTEDPDLSASAQQLAALQAEMEALDVDPALKKKKEEEYLGKDSAREIAALKAQVEAMKSSGAPAPKEVPMTESARQIAALKAQVEAMKNGGAPAHKEVPMTESARQIAALKAQVEAIKNGGAPPKEEPKMSDSARQIAALKAELEAMKNGGAPPKEKPKMSDSARQIAALKAELDAMKSSGAPPPKEEPKMSDSARQIAALKVELEAMKNGNTPKKDAEISESAREAAKLRAELELLKNPSNAQTESARRLEELKEELRRMKEGGVGDSSAISESSRQIADLKEELRRMKEGEGDASAAPSVSPSALQLESLKNELDRLKKLKNEAEESSGEMERLKKEMSELQKEFVPALDSDPDILKRQEEVRKLKMAAKQSETRAQLQRDELKRIREISGGLSLQEAEEKYEAAKGVWERKQKGLDLCLILDATVSMKKYIEQCQETLLKIFDQAQKISGGVVRVAFIAYRDHGLRNQFEPLDFKSEGEELEELRAFIAGVKASTILLPGSAVDPPEDVAGAFEQVKNFTWKSNTRLIFHVADAPCHGTQYHDSRWSDNFPRGDPKFDPEESIKFFAKNRIDYYFLRLDDYTDIMCDKFQRAYRDAVGTRGNFEVIDNGAALDPSKFLPAVIQSLTASCRGV